MAERKRDVQGDKPPAQMTESRTGAVTCGSAQKRSDARKSPGIFGRRR